MNYCGRQFKHEELEIIRTIVMNNPDVSRYRLSTIGCDLCMMLDSDAKQATEVV